MEHISPRESESRGNFLCRSCLACAIRSKSTPKFDFKLFSKFQTLIWIAEDFRECLKDYLSDEFLELVNGQVGNR